LNPLDKTGQDLTGLPRVGDVVAGKYEVERVLGQGGMGIVVAARHKQLGELIAIKLLHPSAALDGEAVARLMREARATISIKSEHVVRIIDVGTLDSGSPYILMEFLKGNDLSAVLHAQGYLAIPDAIDYLLQASEAIAEAHARGIVHRDLKPSNLFLSQRTDGSSLVKVLDFGISKAMVHEDQAPMSLTATRAVFGSPLYMSPEQVRSAKRVDERTDIWALGIILHELLTGSLPFVGETMPGVLASIAADPPEPLRTRRPDAPEGLEQVILRCLVKDVAGRFQTVAEMATALGPFAPPGAELSIQRIQRLALPGSVSRKVASSVPPPEPARSSSPSHPSHPRSSASMALGSTVKATTTSNMALPRQPNYALIGGSVAGTVLAAVALFAVLSRPPAPLATPPPTPASAPAHIDPAPAVIPVFTVPPTAPADTTQADAAAPPLPRPGHLVGDIPRPPARPAPHAGPMTAPPSSAAHPVRSTPGVAPVAAPQPTEDPAMDGR
jgi:serine/threonine protein kinase